MRHILDRQINRQTFIQTYIHTYIHTYIQTDRQCPLTDLVKQTVISVVGAFGILNEHWNSEGPTFTSSPMSCGQFAVLKLVKISYG